MATNKKTLYEILEVSPSATLDEIKAAHKLLSRKLMLSEIGLNREDVDFQLQVLDVALFTLSTHTSRDEYDAQIAPPMKPEPVKKLPLKADVTALTIATALEKSNQLSAEMMANQVSPLQVASTTVNSSIKSLKHIFRFIIGFVVLLVVIKWSISSATHRPPPQPSVEMTSEEEKLYLQEYYQKYGVRPASRAEAELLDVERRRKENAERAAKLEKEKEVEAEQNFVEESRRMAAEVSANLQREEQRARYEAAEKAQRLAEEKRQQEEAERNRVEAEKERLAEERRKLGLSN